MFLTKFHINNIIVINKTPNNNYIYWEKYKDKDNACYYVIFLLHFISINICEEKKLSQSPFSNTNQFSRNIYKQNQIAVFGYQTNVQLNV